MHELYELKDMLCEELKEYGEKGELTAGTLDVVDKLAHTIKNLDKIIEEYDEQEYSNAYNDMGGRSYRQGGRSYARGRRNARRDSMGRYSSRGGYSMDNQSMIEELRGLMQEAPDDRTKQEFQRFITKMEKM